MEVKICLYCGTPYEDVKGYGHCNKDKCRQKVSWDKIREKKGLDKLENRNCLNCGKEFKPRASNQKNCGADCGDEYRRKIRYPAKAREISAKHRERKNKKITDMLAGRSFAQALAEKYGLSLEEN